MALTGKMEKKKGINGLGRSETLSSGIGRDVLMAIIYEVPVFVIP